MTALALIDETPDTILAWSRETFGQRTALKIATRASKEVNEAMCAVLNDAPMEAILDEVADCGVMMWQVAGLLDVVHRITVPTRVPTVGPHGQERVPQYSLAINLQRRFTSVLDDLSSVCHTTDSPHSYAASAKLVIADALLLLERLALTLGIDLQAAVNAKMVINRARKWEQLPNGSYQHVAEGKPVNGTFPHPA